MRAMVISEPGGPEVLQLEEVVDPVPADGDVLIRVRAFGVNHAETHMRKGEWPEATPISGFLRSSPAATYAPPVPSANNVRGLLLAYASAVSKRSY